MFLFSVFSVGTVCDVVHYRPTAPLSALTPPVGEIAASLDLKRSDLLRRLYSRNAKTATDAKEGTCAHDKTAVFLSERLHAMAPSSYLILFLW